MLQRSSTINIKLWIYVKKTRAIQSQGTMQRLIFQNQKRY
jgi:hypothetical protein